MKTLLIGLLILLSGCNKSVGGSSAATTVEFHEEIQYVLPRNFKGYYQFKPIDIGVLDQWGGCLPEGCTLGGIGKDTQINYHGNGCFFDTELIQNYRTNYYYLKIRPRVEDIPNYSYQPNDPECDELLGDFWIHHDGNDNENLLKDGKIFPQPNNMTIEKAA